MLLPCLCKNVVSTNAFGFPLKGVKLRNSVFPALLFPAVGSEFGEGVVQFRHAGVNLMCLALECPRQEGAWVDGFVMGVTHSICEGGDEVGLVGAAKVTESTSNLFEGGHGGGPCSDPFATVYDVFVKFGKVCMLVCEKMWFCLLEGVGFERVPGQSVGVRGRGWLKGDLQSRV